MSGTLRHECGLVKLEVLFGHSNRPTDNKGVEGSIPSRSVPCIPNDSQCGECYSPSRQEFGSIGLGF